MGSVPPDTHTTVASPSFSTLLAFLASVLGAKAPRPYTSFEQNAAAIDEGRARAVRALESVDQRMSLYCMRS